LQTHVNKAFFFFWQVDQKYDLGILPNGSGLDEQLERDPSCENDKYLLFM